MHYAAAYKPKSSVGFNKDHEHKHFQLCAISTNDGGIIRVDEVFVSCPPAGLSITDIEKFLINNYDVDPELDRMIGDEKWYMSYINECGYQLKVLDENKCPSDSCPIYSIDDPELLKIRSVSLESFEYLIERDDYL